MNCRVVHRRPDRARGTGWRAAELGHEAVPAGFAGRRAHERVVVARPAVVAAERAGAAGRAACLRRTCARSANRSARRRARATHSSQAPPATGRSPRPGSPCRRAAPTAAARSGICGCSSLVREHHRPDRGTSSESLVSLNASRSRPRPRTGAAPRRRARSARSRCREPIGGARLGRSRSRRPQRRRTRTGRPRRDRSARPIRLRRPMRSAFRPCRSGSCRPCPRPGHDCACTCRRSRPRASSSARSRLRADEHGARRECDLRFASHRDQPREPSRRARVV